MYYKSMLKVIGSDGVEVKMTHEAYSICIKRWSAMPINNTIKEHTLTSKQLRSVEEFLEYHYYDVSSIKSAEYLQKDDLKETIDEKSYEFFSKNGYDDPQNNNIEGFGIMTILEDLLHPLFNFFIEVELYQVAEVFAAAIAQLNKKIFYAEQTNSNRKPVDPQLIEMATSIANKIFKEKLENNIQSYLNSQKNTNVNVLSQENDVSQVRLDEL